MPTSNSDNLNLKPSTFNLKLTLKAWPVIAAATIGLCFLTQHVAGWLGIALPDQANIGQIRKMGIYAWRTFMESPLGVALSDRVVSAFLINIPAVLVFMPMVEEAVFRQLLFKLPSRLLPKRRIEPTAAILSSAVFSAAHYISQPWPDSAFLALFFFGLAQCWLYKKTGHLWCAILNHALFNLTNFVLLFILPANAAS